MTLGVRKLTLIAALAAVYAAVSLLPSFPMIGVPGSRISIARSLEMGYGFILGPLLGPLTAFLGAVTGKILTQDVFGMWFTPLALISAFVAAAASRRTVFGMRGWVLATMVSTIFILGWYATPVVGREAFYYPVLHLIGLGILLVGRGRLAEYVNSRNRRKATIGVALCSFSSTMAGHMAGNLLFMALLGVNSAFLFIIPALPIAAVERLIITVLGTVIGVPLLLVVREVFPDLLGEESHG